MYVPCPPHVYIFQNSVSLPTLDTLEIFNFPAQPDFNSFQLNGKKINVNVQTSQYSPITKILTISTKNLIQISTATQVFLFFWQFNPFSDSNMEQLRLELEGQINNCIYLLIELSQCFFFYHANFGH